MSKLVMNISNLLRSNLVSLYFNKRSPMVLENCCMVSAGGGNTLPRAWETHHCQRISGAKPKIMKNFIQMQSAQQSGTLPITL